MTYDVIVVGVGGMGSATTYHLVLRGQKVLALEQFDIPHDLGSSHGVNRIIRLAYAEHPNYVPLLRRAYELWRELERKVGEQLLFITGGIDAGAENSATVQGSLQSCAVHGLPYERFDAAALHRRFPGYHLNSDMVAVYQPDAGFVLSERSIIAHVVVAQALGAEIRAREAVKHWRANKNGSVSVTTSRKTYHARKMIVTAGPWTRKLIPELEQYAIPERQVLLWTQPRKLEYFKFGAFPVFKMEAPEGRFYGLPTFSVPGFKIGKYHHRRERVDNLNNMDRECHSEDEEVLREAIRRYFPEADGPTMAMKTCLFTNSPDEHFILDRLPSQPQVGVAAGFSGHGFKFCSVVGEIMAELMIDASTRFDISMFRLNRLPALTRR